MLACIECTQVHDCTSDVDTCIHAVRSLHTIVFLRSLHLVEWELLNIDFCMQASLSTNLFFSFFTGIAALYFILQAIILLSCHTATLFWAVRFPLHRKYHERLGHMKYIHIAVVLVGLLLPSIPVIAALSTGGFITTFSPLYCTAKNMDANFYSFILPNAITAILTMTILVLILWIIAKDSNMWGCHRGQAGENGQVGSSNPMQFPPHIQYIL